MPASRKRTEQAYRADWAKGVIRVSPQRRIKVTRSSPCQGDDETAPKGKYSVITCWGRGSPVRPFQRADDRGMTRARPPEPRLLSLSADSTRWVVAALRNSQKNES